LSSSIPARHHGLRFVAGMNEYRQNSHLGTALLTSLPIKSREASTTTTFSSLSKQVDVFF
jgi:hypothetical protein